MLQILGWLGCLMLAIKLTELSHIDAMRNEEGKLRGCPNVMIGLGWIGVFVFALWIGAQGQAVEDAYATSAYSSDDPYVQRQALCIEAQAAGEPLPSFC